MSFIISAPSTDNGKTTLALLISSWASSKGIKIQTFKVGPDYLDQQQLSHIGHPICRNLDIFLSGETWVKKTFHQYSRNYEFSLIEGAMGLFDGLGSTRYSSTANVAKLLDLPIVFIIDARGKVASLLALYKGFQELDKNLKISGIVFNNVNSNRHQKLIKEVFKNQPVEIIGFLPFNEEIKLKKGNLGLISPKEKDDAINTNYYAYFAEKHLNFKLIEKLLKYSITKSNYHNFTNSRRNHLKKTIAIAEDKIFHFQYPETKEYLEEIGVTLIPWSLYKDEEIPKEACTVMIPGGFPERYAEHISSSKKSLNSLKAFFKKGLIYAECGGMMILGNSIEDENGQRHKMSEILPFSTKKGKLSVGYRSLKGEKESLLINKGQEIKGHEFHYWQINNEIKDFENGNSYKKELFKPPWKIKSWGSQYKSEGWSCKNLHASWVHIHLPSNTAAARNFLNKVNLNLIN